jgi:hypothetical protein
VTRWGVMESRQTPDASRQEMRDWYGVTDEA